MPAFREIYWLCPCGVDVPQDKDAVNALPTKLCAVPGRCNLSALREGLFSKRGSR